MDEPGIALEFKWTDWERHAGQPPTDLGAPEHVTLDDATQGKLNCARYAGLSGEAAEQVRQWLELNRIAYRFRDGSKEASMWFPATTQGDYSN
jgi:hypothetical protein